MRHPAEEEALCLGARTVLAEAHQERWWACLRRVQDWNYLCWAAQQHGVAGLLSQHLPEEVPEVAEGNWEIRKLGNWEIRKLGPDLTDQSQLPSCPVAQLPSCPVAQLPSCPVAQLPDPLVPPAVRERLAHLAHLTAFQNLRAQSDLERLLAAFGQEEIPVIVLKGPALIEAVYHNPALRPMLDLDLLVPREALPAARQVMETHGYQPERPHSQHAWETEHFHLTYRRPVGDHFPVEIHWDVLAPRPGAPWCLNPAPMWDRAWNGTFGRATARLLAPEDQLLYLAWHHFIHGLAGLLNLCDIAEVVRQYGTALDWERLLRQAEQGHTTLLLAYMLWWTATYLDAPVPEAVWAQQRGRVQRIHRWHIGLDRSPLPSAHLLLNPLAHLLRQRPFFPHPLAFARFAAAALFPSAASFARFHPTTESPQRYAYYLFRFTRLRSALRCLGQIMGW